MKKLLILAIAIVVFSCSKDNLTTIDPITLTPTEEPVDDTTTIRSCDVIVTLTEYMSATLQEKGIDTLYFYISAEGNAVGNYDTIGDNLYVGYLLTNTHFPNVSDSVNYAGDTIWEYTAPCYTAGFSTFNFKFKAFYLTLDTYIQYDPFLVDVFWNNFVFQDNKHDEYNNNCWYGFMRSSGVAEGECYHIILDYLYFH